MSVRRALGCHASHSPIGQSMSVGPWSDAPDSDPQIGIRSLGPGVPRLSERQGRQFTLFFPHLFILVPK